MDRFWAKVEKTDECWIWTAARISSGYGCFYLDGSKLAHRVSYELCVGQIPDGLVIDHLCRNKLCVNPAHLEAVTQRTNVARGTLSSSVSAANKRRGATVTHCPRGHEYTPENTKISVKGWRSCRTCNAASERKRRSKLTIEEGT